MIEYNFFEKSDSQDNRDIINQISKLRYDVYSKELGQYDNNDNESLEDPGNFFIAAIENEKLVGYISFNDNQNFRMVDFTPEEIFENEILSNLTGDISSTFEVRALTVNNKYRGRKISNGLMLNALKKIFSFGGTDIIAMGHVNVIDLYQKIGMSISESSFFVGSAEYFPMHMCVRTTIERYSNLINLEEDPCYHGGASWDTSGFDFSIRDSLIVADVLDSPFPPCPEALEVISSQLERCCQESPPTHSAELIKTISTVRNISKNNILVSSGSSSLMFSCLPRLLNKDSKVLILSPMYGEYEHILKHVIGCEITLFPIYPEQDFLIDKESLIEISRTQDAIILVNPNSPTGVYSNEIKYIIEELNNSKTKSKCSMIWIDETYIDYIEDSISMESLVSKYSNIIICKSMSKCYALSGLRVAYLASQKAEFLRKYIPPWSVSLPAQLAAIYALKNPEYYTKNYNIIHDQRRIISEQLFEIGFTVYPGVANFILTTLPKDTIHTSKTFIEACKGENLFVRDAENMGVTLTNKSVRFAIKNPYENRKMIEIVNRVINT